MGRTGNATRCGGVVAAGALAVAGILAGGCGSPVRTSQASWPRTAVTGPVAVPPGGSPAEARAAGTRALASLILPAGSRRIAPRSAPPGPLLLASQNIVDVSRFYWLPLPENAAITYLMRHVPAGTSQTGSGSAAGFQDVEYSLTTSPAGLEQGNTLQATVTVGPHNGTLLRADAEMQWYPARSAAEYLAPGGYRSVTITVSASVTRAHAKPQTVTRVFTSPAVIATLARLLDGLHASAPWMGSCPAGLPQFQIAFAPKRHLQTQAVTPDGCRGELISTGGLPQPALEDGDSIRLLAVLGPLLSLPRDLR